MTIYDTIRDVLRRKSPDIWSISPDSSVYQAIEMMADKHIGALLVLPTTSSLELFRREIMRVRWC
jgi:CBS domain-containing protein